MSPQVLDNKLKQFLRLYLDNWTFADASRFDIEFNHDQLTVCINIMYNLYRVSRTEALDVIFIRGIVPVHRDLTEYEMRCFNEIYKFTTQVMKHINSK